MDMTGALLADIMQGSSALANIAGYGGASSAEGAGESFKGILGGILTAAQTAPQQKVFTQDPIAADTAEEKTDMSLLDSKNVTDAVVSPATERALKYLTGSILEEVTGKPDGYFTAKFFELFKYKTQLDLNINKEKADEEEAGGITDLWTTLLDSLNGTEVTEMSMFSANLGDALFGKERDYSRSSASILSDLFDSLSTRNKTDLLKASGTDLADIAAMALAASGGMAGLIDKTADNNIENDTAEADEELSMLIEAADDETVDILAEKLNELVEQAESKLAENTPVPADNSSKSVPDTQAVTVSEEIAAQTETAYADQLVTAEAYTEQAAETAGISTVNAAESAVISYSAAAVSADDAGRDKDNVPEKAAVLDMKTVSVRQQDTALKTDAADFPDSSLKDLYLSMRNFSKTSSENPEKTPFVFEANTGVSAEDPEMPADELMPQTVRTSLSREDDESGSAEGKTDTGTAGLVAPEEKIPFTAVPAESDITAEPKDQRGVLEDRYNTIEQVLSRIEENNFSGSGTRELVVKLTPETLGEITVRIAKDVTGAVEITLAAQNRDVSELISSRASELAQSLADKGTAVSSVNVVDPAQSGQNLAFDMNGGQNAFNFRQQDLGYHFSAGSASADDEEDDTIAAVSAADSNDNNNFVPKEAKLWQKI